VLKKICGIALAAGLTLVPHRAHATDTLLAGKRLVIGNSVPDNEKRNRIVLTARDETLAISAPGSTGDPTCAGAGGGGGRITVTSRTSGESFTSVLPCQNWTGRKTGSWRYRDNELDGPCQMVQIRSTRTLRATCVGRGPSVLDFDLVPGQPQAPIDGRKFFGQNSPAPGACAAPPPAPSE